MKWICVLLFIFSQNALAKELPAKEKPFWGSLLFNSVSLDISDSRTQVNLQDRDSLATKNRPVDNSAGDLSRFINSISISKIPENSKETGAFQFEAVPIFTFAFHNLIFDSPAAYLEQTHFQIFRTSVGYGPELTYNSDWGAFYSNLSPGIAYSWVSWSSPISGGSMAKSNLNLAMTVGYYRRFMKNWALKFFFKDVFEDKGVWKEALSSSQGFEVPVIQVNNLVSGFSLCWVFR